jgi:hypothetical protein
MVGGARGERACLPGRGGRGHSSSQGRRRQPGSETVPCGTELRDGHIETVPAGGPTCTGNFAEALTGLRYGIWSPADSSEYVQLTNFSYYATPPRFPGTVAWSRSSATARVFRERGRSRSQQVRRRLPHFRVRRKREAVCEQRLHHLAALIVGDRTEMFGVPSDPGWGWKKQARLPPHCGLATGTAHLQRMGGQTNSRQTRRLRPALLSDLSRLRRRIPLECDQRE